MLRALTIIPGLALLLTGCIASSPKLAVDPVPLAHEVRQPHFAIFGTNKVYYMTAGKGPQTLVFVHGWACNGNFWREQVAAFRDQARLIFVDLPGHGQSDKPHRDYTTEFFADAVLAVMKSEKVNKATLVGHSQGTAVICRVYAQGPEKVSGLVAVEGYLRSRKLPRAESQKLIAPYRTADYREQVKRSVTSMFPSPGTERLRAEVLKEMLNTPQHVIVSPMENSFDPEQPAWDLKSVNVPLLILNVRSATWTPEYEAYVRSLSTRTEVRTFDGVGHFLMLEKPHLFNEALTEMLRKFDLVAK